MEMGKISSIGPDLVKDTSEKVDLIRKRLLMAQSRQKNYINRWRRHLSFEVGDHMFLKVMLIRGVVRFRKQGKLSPRYIGPFKVLKRVGTFSYRLALPSSLLSDHEVFHVSMIRTYTHDPNHVSDGGELVIDADGTFEERPLDRDPHEQVLFHWYSSAHFLPLFPLHALNAFFYPSFLTCS